MLSDVVVIKLIYYTVTATVLFTEEVKVSLHLQKQAAPNPFLLKYYFYIKPHNRFICTVKKAVQKEKKKYLNDLTFDHPFVQSSTDLRAQMYAVKVNNSHHKTYKVQRTS